MDRCWNYLPNDVLRLIAIRLDSVIDLLRFRSTCQSWRYSSITIKQYSARIRNQEKDFGKLPALYVDTSTNIYGSVQSIRLYWLRISKLYAVKHDSSNEAFVASVAENYPGEILISPIDSSLRVVSSSKESTSAKRSELNMLEVSLSEVCRFYTLKHIGKPSFGTKVPVKIMKVAIIRSKLPHNKFYVAVILCANFGPLGVFHSGQNKWKVTNNHQGFNDIVTRSGEALINAVDNRGRLFQVDLSSKTTEVVAKSDNTAGIQKYLVESRGELLLLDRYVRETSHGNGVPSEIQSYFKIYKLKLVSREWIAVKSLGEQVIVLDDPVCFCVSCQDLSLSRGNCICYRKDCRVLIHHFCTNGDEVGWKCFWSGAPLPTPHFFN